MAFSQNLSITLAQNFENKTLPQKGAPPPPLFTKTGIFSTTQGWKNRILVSHERVDSRFLVLAGSEWIYTEITEYMYFSLIQTRLEFKCKSD